MTLEEKIKEALKKANLNELLFEKIKNRVKKEADIPESIKFLQDEQELTKLIDDNKKGDFFKKYLQSTIDREVTKAIQTREANLKTEIKAELEKAQKEEADRLKREEEEKNQADNLTPEQKEVYSLKKDIEKLTGLVTQLSETSTKNQKETVIKQALKDAELPEELYSIIKVDSLDKVGEAVENIKQVITDSQQKTIDEKLNNNNGDPERGDSDNSGISVDVVTEYIKHKESGEDQPFKGKPMLGLSSDTNQKNTSKVSV